MREVTDPQGQKKYRLVTAVSGKTGGASHTSEVDQPARGEGTAVSGPVGLSGPRELAEGEAVLVERPHKAILSGDDVTATAVLGAPAYLSGIDPKMMPVLIRTYREHNSPEVAAKLRVMQGAAALLAERGGLLFTNLEKAVGAQPHEVQKLRDAKKRSEKAFAA